MTRPRMYTLRFRELRQRAGLTQRRMARELGMEPIQLSRIERGKHDIKVSTVLRLRSYLEERLGQPLALDDLLVVRPAQKISQN